LGILNEHEAVETHEYFHNEFRNCKIVLIKEKIQLLTVCYLLVWADNGDILSKQYAGTGALKSDFTRTGQRTTYGALRDGANSLYRYVINNFYDGSKQVCDSEIVLAFLNPFIFKGRYRFIPRKLSNSSRRRFNCRFLPCFY
jgi:hypothetical protein